MCPHKTIVYFGHRLPLFKGDKMFVEIKALSQNLTTRFNFMMHDFLLSKLFSQHIEATSVFKLSPLLSSLIDFFDMHRLN
jgi:hypothetical protein